MELDQLKLGISFTNKHLWFQFPRNHHTSITRIVQKQGHQAKLFKGVAELHSSSFLLGHPSAAATNSARKHYYECRRRTRTRATAWFVKRGHSATAEQACILRLYLPYIRVRSRVRNTYTSVFGTIPPANSYTSPRFTPAFFRWLYIAKKLYIFLK
jgi:hypothetical protein